MSEIEHFTPNPMSGIKHLTAMRLTVAGLHWVGGLSFLGTTNAIMD